MKETEHKEKILILRSSSDNPLLAMTVTNGSKAHSRLIYGISTVEQGFPSTCDNSITGF